MNLLRGSTVYLAGSIDFHQDPRGWRNRIREELLTPLGVRVYDPLIKPSWFSPAARGNPNSYREALRSAAGGEESNTITDAAWEAMAQIRKADLRFASDANFVICSLPKVFTVGTMEELAVATNAGKPILFHLPDGAGTSTWLPVQVAKSMDEYLDSVFYDWKSLYQRLLDIDAGRVRVDNYKWIFLSYFNDLAVKAVLDEIPSHQPTRTESV